MIPFEHLGPYRVGETIGRGGMGSVYQAVHEKTGEQVAVKLIAASVADDIRFRRRFQVEIDTLKRLKHPNIVTLIGYGEEQGQLFYSMEWVRGETLQQRLKREKRLAWPESLNLGIDVCSALRYAHNFGVIHRDLKPANLMFAEDGSPKIVDFGIAKLFGNAEQTVAGSVLGTADYMAPEQAGDGGVISPRTDLYALGNVLYACFAGRSPFAGRSMTRVIEALHREAPAPLDIVVPDLPIEIVRLVHDLLEKDPENRPPTALAVMNRMMAIRAGLNRQAATVKQLPDDAPEDKLTNPGTAVRAKSDTSIKTDQPTSAESPTIPADDEIAKKSPATRLDRTVPETPTPKTAKAVNTKRDDDFVFASPAKLLSKASSIDANVSTSLTDADQSHLVTSDETRFSTIDDAERRRGFWESQQQSESPNSLFNVLSIAAMIALLLGAVGVFIWSMQRPSADSLYQAMIQTRDNEDAAILRIQMDQFRRLYPEDARYAELEPFLDQRDASRIVRRLQMVSSREGGDDFLAPAEQAFLAAMRDIRRNPVSAQSRLRQWLSVYDPPVSGDSPPPQSHSIAELSVAVRKEIDKLAEIKTNPPDPRAAELLQRLAWGKESLDRVALREMCSGIVALHGEEAWAKPVVDAARMILVNSAVD